MIQTLIEIRKSILKYLTIFSPVLTLIIVYIYKWDLANLVAKLSPTLEKELAAKPALSYTVNSALIVLIISLIIELLKHPGEFKVEMQNNSRKNDSYFDIRSVNSHHPATIHIDSKFKFKNKFIFWLIKILGGVTLNVSFPDWIDYKIENKKDIEKTILKQEKSEFIIDIGKTVQKKKIDSTKYIKVSIISNASDINTGSIVPSIELKSTWKILRFFLYIILALFFDIKITNYEVEARSDID